MLDRILVSVPFVLAVAACSESGAPPPTPGSPSQLEIATLDDTSLAGLFYRAGSIVRFESRSEDQQRASLRLVVNGSSIGVELVLADQFFIDDGHDTALYEDDLAVL